MPGELCWLSAVELAAEIRAGRVSPSEAVDDALARIDRLNPQLNAIVTRCDDAARQRAREIESALTRGDEVGPLAGVPITIKDLHLTAGLRTTFGSKLYEDFVPEHDSPIVERLRRAGAIILGKTNTAEFGLVPLTCSALLGDAHNPWDPARNTGGSSGGSAAAVACGIGPLATGSDGGGSIRVPAAFCGVFGLKPHLGRIPHIPFPRGWESLSHQGVLTRTVRDTALALDVLAGPLEADRWSLPAPTASYLAACDGEIAGLRLAWSPGLGSFDVEPEVLAVLRASVEKFARLGCTIDEVELDLPDLGPAQQTIVLCEASAALGPRREEWERVPFAATRKLLTNADRMTYQDLIRAQWARDAYAERIAPLFANYDALLTAVTPIPATLNGTLGPKEINGQKQRALFWLNFCVPFNMTGQPAASLPVGFTPLGLPVGLQLVGRRFDEATLLRLAAAYETAYPWADRRPPLAR